MADIELGKQHADEDRIKLAVQTLYAALHAHRQVNGDNSSIAVSRSETSLRTVEALLQQHPDVEAIPQKTCVLLALKQSFERVTSEQMRSSLASNGMSGISAVRDELSLAREDAGLESLIRAATPHREADAVADADDTHSKE